jgi:two-component system nitrate/nitrite response regulator NarP
MIPVLVADDHGFIRAGVEAVLRGTRFAVVAATASGEETLAAIKTHNPEIVLLDINMPGMNGVKALETLRERGDNRSVVLLTAEINNEQLMSVMRAGVDGIISKDGAEDENGKKQHDASNRRKDLHQNHPVLHPGCGKRRRRPGLNAA